MTVRSHTTIPPPNQKAVESNANIEWKHAHALSHLSGKWIGRAEETSDLSWSTPNSALELESRLSGLWQATSSSQLHRYSSVCICQNRTW